MSVDLVSFRMPAKDYEDWKNNPKGLMGYTVTTDFLGAPVKGKVIESEAYVDEHLGPGIWVTILPVD